jgi:hypothetical protein
MLVIAFVGDIRRKGMIKATIAKSLTVVGLLALATTAASADENLLNPRATLSGFNEVPPKATNGAGTFRAKAGDGVITFTLTYSGLSTPAFMSHLHFAQPGVNGGIFVWLCGTAGGKQACPPGTTARATVTGQITAADITAVPDQGVAAMDLATALRIIQNGDAYVNVHTSKYPGGEIRGQVSAGESNNH